MTSVLVARRNIYASVIVVLQKQKPTSLCNFLTQLTALSQPQSISTARPDSIWSGLGGFPLKLSTTLDLQSKVLQNSSDVIGTQQQKHNSGGGHGLDGIPSVPQTVSNECLVCTVDSLFTSVLTEITGLTMQ